MEENIRLEENKNRFIDELSKVDRNGIEGLIEYLVVSDFFTAPASTKYHCDFAGGLCQHSLNVFDNIMKLNEMYDLKIDEDSLRLVSLLHDVSKTNFYEEYFQNKKLYSDGGSKFDEGGRYDWVSVKSYKIKEPELRMVSGEHGFNSYMIIKDYVKLTDPEITAIVNHHLGMDNGYCFKDMNEVCDRYPLVPLLHLADMCSVYFTENKYHE